MPDPNVDGVKRKPMIAKSRILLVEDNQITSRTLVLFLAAENYDVQCAIDGRNALKFFREQTYDLVKLDLMLPDVDGIQVCQSIRANSSIPIIVLSAKTTEDEIVHGLESGADDYVCKPFGSKVLLARVRRCLQRATSEYQPTSAIRVGDLELDLERRVVQVGGQVIKLTKSEFDVLAVLIQHPGRVFTRDQLIGRALGIHFEGFERTIDTHIWSLRKKIGEPRGNPKYILSEQGVGYRMSDQNAQ